MGKQKSILVPVDGSEASFRGLDKAVELASAMSHQVYVVSIVDTDQLDTYAGAYLNMEKVVDVAREETIEKAIKRIGNKVPVKTHITHGHVRKSLLAASKEVDVVMVVIGKTGKGAIETALEGSVSRWMSQHAAVPVVIVP